MRAGGELDAPGCARPCCVCTQPSGATSGSPSPHLVRKHASQSQMGSDEWEGMQWLGLLSAFSIYLTWFWKDSKVEQYMRLRAGGCFLNGVRAECLSPGGQEQGWLQKITVAMQAHPTQCQTGE